MNVERHPFFGAVTGLLLGAGLATMAVIYGVLPVGSLVPPAGITVGFTLVGGVAAMVWPPPNEGAFD